MTEEDEAFNDIERRSKVKQTLIVHKSKEAMLTAEVAVLTEMVRVLSDKVSEMEALAQPEQEPVGVVDSTISGHIDWLCTFFPKQGTKLYTTPPQHSAIARTWVGLTEQEAAECWSTSTVRTWQSIEAKLKEKNT
jgi:hypothetical protein